MRDFLWVFLKNKVYANKPATIEELKENIRVEISKITVATCQNVIENVVFRLDTAEKSLGGHLPDVVFHT